MAGHTELSLSGSDLNRSPLSLVMQVPSVSRLVEQLQRARHKIMADPTRVHNLHFSRRELQRAREDFNRAIRRGQAKLHRLAGLLCATLFDSLPELTSVVVGEVEKSHERFTLTQTLREEELYDRTDQELGKQQLRRLRFVNPEDQSVCRARLVANFVEYLPLQTNPHQVHKIISRIKAEQEIWNKVVDEIFDIDAIVRRDKELLRMSRYVKDIFGVKILVGEGEAALQLQEFLARRRWSPEELATAQVPFGEDTATLQFLETKDYLGGNGKESGWQAIKSVVRWWDTTTEIQIQPVYNYYRELERLNMESHASFRARRHALREELDHALPLFRFYRELLRWMLHSWDTPAPTYPSVLLEISD